MRLEQGFFDGLSCAYVRNVTFFNTDDMPTVCYESSSFADISLCVSMPVISVDLKSDPNFRDKKINAVASDFALLDEVYAKIFKFDSDGRLQLVLTPVSAVTSLGTKNTIGQRLFPKFFFTVVADKSNNRPAAQFRTIFSILMGFKKSFFTTGTINVGCIVSNISTRIRTYEISVGYRCTYSKVFSTHRTKLINSVLFGFVDFIAVPGTKSSVPQVVSGQRTIGRAALFALKKFWMFSCGGEVARLRTVFSSVANRGVTALSLANHGPIVYCNYGLKVKENR